MSALPPIADIDCDRRHPRLDPLKLIPYGGGRYEEGFAVLSRRFSYRNCFDWVAYLQLRYRDI